MKNGVKIRMPQPNARKARPRRGFDPIFEIKATDVTGTGEDPSSGPEEVHQIDGLVHCLILSRPGGAWVSYPTAALIQHWSSNRFARAVQRRRISRLRVGTVNFILQQLGLPDNSVKADDSKSAAGDG
jgi:hypothetical protein